MKNPVPTFAYLVSEIAQKYSDLAYLHFVEPVASGASGAEDESRDVDLVTGTVRFIKLCDYLCLFLFWQPSSNDFARVIWQPRPFLCAGGFTAETALLEADSKDICIVMGRHFISNVSQNGIIGAEAY